MNATEDGEPLGESPAIDTLTAIGRGAVLGVLSAADEVLAVKQLTERQTQALNAVRAIHQRGLFSATGKFFCKHCRAREVEWPCPTIRAIDSAGA